MSSCEIDSKHSNGAKKKKVRLTTLADEVSCSTNTETNDFDFQREKPPARSTYVQLIKTLNKNIVQPAHTVPVYNAFDRIKICIDYGYMVKLLSLKYWICFIRVHWKNQSHL